MACERTYDPKIKGFSSPDWQELDLDRHFTLYKKAMLYSAEHTNSPEGMKLSNGQIEELIADLPSFVRTWKVRLSIASLDIAGNGNEHNVLRVIHAGCGPHAKRTDTSLSSDLYIVNDTLTDLDYPMQERTRGWLSHATVELYEGKPYVEAYLPDDNWGHLLTGSGVLHVLRYERSSNVTMHAQEQGEGPRTICELHYMPSAGIYKRDPSHD